MSKLRLKSRGDSAKRVLLSIAPFINVFKPAIFESYPSCHAARPAESSANISIINTPHLPPHFPNLEIKAPPGSGAEFQSVMALFVTFFLALLLSAVGTGCIDQTGKLPLII